jgi:hypothetical protein
MLISPVAQAIVFAFSEHRPKAWLGAYGEYSTLDKKLIIGAAAAPFAAGTLATTANAQSTNKCYRVNSCKGQSDCTSYRTSCKGKNACRGQGMTVTGTTLECVARGGAPTP